MAAWQASFAIIPSRTYPADYQRRLDAVAPRAPSWSNEIQIWGMEDGNRIDLYLENGAPHDGLIRIDLRDPDPAFIRGTLAFLAASGCGLESEDGHWVEPNEGEFLVALRGSRAFRFVEDPARYLSRLRAGGLEDA